MKLDFTTKLGKRERQALKAAKAQWDWRTGKPKQVRLSSLTVVGGSRLPNHNRSSGSRSGKAWIIG